MLTYRLLTLPSQPLSRRPSTRQGVGFFYMLSDWPTEAEDEPVMLNGCA